MTKCDLLILGVRGVIQFTVEWPIQRLIQELEEDFAEEGEIRESLKTTRMNNSKNLWNKNTQILIKRKINRQGIDIVICLYQIVLCSSENRKTKGS